MKFIVIISILLNTISILGNNINEVKVESKIKSLTLFLTGGEATREAEPYWLIEWWENGWSNFALYYIQDCIPSVPLLAIYMFVLL